MAKVRFIFEDLEIWTKAVEFAKLVIDSTEAINALHKHYRILEQLEAAATSIALNIAEGKGRYSKREFIQFLYIARGSLYESVTLIRIFYEKHWITDKTFDELQKFAYELSKMLSCLIVAIRNSIT